MASQCTSADGSEDPWEIWLSAKLSMLDVDECLGEYVTGIMMEDDGVKLNAINTGPATTNYIMAYQYKHDIRKLSIHENRQFSLTAQH